MKLTAPVQNGNKTYMVPYILVFVNAITRFFSLIIRHYKFACLFICCEILIMSNSKIASFFSIMLKAAKPDIPSTFECLKGTTEAVGMGCDVWSNRNEDLSFVYNDHWNLDCWRWKNNFHHKCGQNLQKIWPFASHHQWPADCKIRWVLMWTVSKSESNEGCR